MKGIIGFGAVAGVANLTGITVMICGIVTKNTKVICAGAGIVGATILGSGIASKVYTDRLWKKVEEDLDNFEDDDKVVDFKEVVNNM